MLFIILACVLILPDMIVRGGLSGTTAEPDGSGTGAVAPATLEEAGVVADMAESGWQDTATQDVEEGTADAGAEPEAGEENEGGENVGEAYESGLEQWGLAELTTNGDEFVIDLRYATENNFTGKSIYENPRCLLLEKTAEKLISANREFMELGYRIKILDAYRPLSVQRILWDAASDKSFVANPSRGSMHNRGAAVDVTLVDMEGNELDMPSGYDEFTERARLDYRGCTDKQAENRELLGEIMVKHGFTRIRSEWWHFDDNPQKSKPVLDIQFNDF